MEQCTQDPCFILTDLPVEQEQARWYGLCSRIKSGFKDGKRGGWNWQSCRCKQPERVEYLKLAMAAAALAEVRVDAEREAQAPFPSLDHPPLTHIARRMAKAALGHPNSANNYQVAEDRHEQLCGLC